MNNVTPGGAPNRAGLFQELTQNALLVWRLLLDPRVPALTKLVPLAAFLYILFPLDVVPDLIPGLGQLDDLAVLVIGVRAFMALCPPDRVQAHRSASGASDAAAAASDGKTVDGSFRVMDDQ